MTRVAFVLCLLAVARGLSPEVGFAQGDEGKLRIIVFGAHPDDPEKVGGTMARFVAMGHKVRLVSLTNGNAGHFSMGGGPLARRRYAESQCAGRAIGAEYVVLDHDDGTLMPTREMRDEVIRQMREFRADIVISPRPNDYHPDHRNTALLVQDAAYMVTVPNIVPLTPHLQKNPVFLYMSDRFTEPSPFVPDIAVAVDDVIEQKIDMYHCHQSQMYEWLPYNQGILDQVPSDTSKRREWMAQTRGFRSSEPGDTYRELLIQLYGQRVGSQVRQAEAFQVSEYGTQPSREELKKLFPFFTAPPPRPSPGGRSRPARRSWGPPAG
jgi:LmbE family N-acetylglucosaminyl deacetylase